MSKHSYHYGQDGEGWFCVDGPQYPRDCFFLGEGQAKQMAEFLNNVADKNPQALPISEYHEDDGNVVWWAWENGAWLGEPAWIGTPSDSHWPGYHTHWTPHPAQPEKGD